MRKLTGIRFIFLLFWLYVNPAFGQIRSGEIQVTYKMYCDTDIPLQLTTVLRVKNNIAIYQEMASTTQRWEEKPLSDKLEGKGVDVSKLKSDFEPYFRTDPSKHELLFYATLLRNTALVQDTYTIEWNVTAETKTIGGYNCIKATTNFRGREWIAWFTPEIALPFGPWKFHGLPGLIIEAYDVSNRYTYKLEKIGPLQNPEIFGKDFKALIPAINKDPMPYRQYLADKDEAFANAMRSIDQKLNVKTTVGKTDRSLQEEVRYEWEEK